MPEHLSFLMGVIQLIYYYRVLLAEQVFLYILLLAAAAAAAVQILRFSDSRRDLMQRQR
jgi:hypothetical protein